jgi:phosphocarrier protein HPr
VRRNSMHDANATRASKAFAPLTASAVLVNPVGLHARPSVKLT